MEVMGRERFQEYVLPLYREAVEELHRYGKLLGAHLDGNNAGWADLVAGSGLDYVEAFTPDDTDMTMEDAVDVWKEKILWINFPSSVHLASTETIERKTEEIVVSLRKHGRVIIGITEDIPADHWQRSLGAISRVINRFPL